MVTLIAIKFVVTLPFIWAATHWVVTENGRIAPQMDSLYQLDKPHDLMALLYQEDRIAQADILRQELFKKRVEFEQRDDKDSGTMIEEKLYTSDPDCMKVGRKVTTMAIFESTFANFNFYGIDIHKELLTSEPGQKEPNCDTELDFSMQAFEHLNGMLQRSNLKMDPETSLESYIPEEMDLKTFANWIAYNIEKNSTHWVAYNLATLYYRILGSSYKAMQCCRLALHFSPRSYKTIALVSMGNLLTHSHFQEDAVIVLHAAVDHSPSDPIAQYTLANNYALIGDLNRSVLCYENVLKLQPDMKVAVRKMHGIQCLSKLEKALETQHSVLQNTLIELKDQQKKFEEWNRLQEKIVNAQATVSQRLRSQLEYQEYRLNSVKTAPLQDCEQYEEDGIMFFQCNIKTDMSTLDTWGSAMIDLRNRLVDFQTQTDKIADLLSLRNVGINQSSLNNEPNDSSLVTRDVGEEPTLPAKYKRKAENTSVSVQKLSERELQLCTSTNVPKVNDIPSVLLAPETEGFDIETLLNEKIGLHRNEDHPLPWYPPICDKYPLKLTPYDEIQAIKNRNQLKVRIRDFSVQRHLLNYTGMKSEKMENSDQEDEIQTAAALAQIGQRILTALRNKIGPPWLLNTLAGLYWRGHGNTLNGVECFRQALSTVPQQYVHIPLTNLAALFVKTGHTKDALTLATMSFNAHNNIPNTNFLLGLIHLMSSNYSLSAVHFQRVLNTESEFAEADHFRIIATCLSLEKAASLPKLQCRGDPGTSTTYRTVLRCSRTDEDDDKEGSCDAENQNHLAKLGSLEVAAIADTEDSLDVDLASEEEMLRNLEFLQEDSLPEGLLRMGKLSAPLHITLEQCQGHRMRSKSQFTSTWLSVGAKNIDFRGLLPKSIPSTEFQEPVCDSAFPVTMATMDHLVGVRHRDKIPYRSESALEEALSTLVFDDKEHVHTAEVGKYLSYALKHNATSWVLTTAASLYWRVKGNVKNAIDCLRIALHHAPYNVKDIPLISLANVLHRAGLHNDALVAAYMALEISPTFVVIHFTVANIHAARGDTIRALSFYQSTLSLQPSFEPAREQLIELHCKQLLLEERKDVDY